MDGYKWGFDMVDVNAVHSLAYALSGPDVVILAEEEDARPPEFYFSSKHLNELTNESEVRGRAMKLKTLFDGALILDHEYGYRPEDMHELWAMDHFSRRGTPIPASNISTFSPAICAERLTEWQVGAIKKSFVDASIYAARTDQIVMDILQILGTNGVNWTSLYALTDTMKTNGFGEAAQSTAAGCTKAEYGEFKHTANSFAAVGPAARHGQTKHQPPSTPMSLSRAAEIVLGATRAFVKKRNQRVIAALTLKDMLSEPDISAPPTRKAAKPVPKPTETVSAHLETAGERTISTRSRRRVPIAVWAAGAVVLAIPLALIDLARRRRRS